MLCLTHEGRPAVHGQIAAFPQVCTQMGPGRSGIAVRFGARPMRSLIFVDCVREEYRHRLQHWLYNTHIPDSISKFTPYCVKYAFYNALPVPPGGERFGTRRMQMTEHYWLINEMLPEMRNNAFGEVMPPEVLRWQGMLPDSDEAIAQMANMTGEEHRSSGGDNGCPPFVFAHVPINWEEDFKGAGRTVKDGPNYRWQFVLRWPCEKTGEKWFHDVMAPYFQNRPEVTRFLSSRIYHDVVGCQFHRLVELWFEGPDEWCTAIEAAKQELAQPEWAKEAPEAAPQAQFPFLKSNFGIVGMFLTDYAASDNMTQFRGNFTMR